ncbi:MAG: hypothetical protein IID18_01800 [Nitrospinae bacterium]|nr:hypothetical protein [Nitrospinota bacterium]
MPDSNAVEDSIKHSIKKNGFPERTVRLPFKAIFDSCKRHDTALKDVLDKLLQEKIVGTIQGDHIEFRSADRPAPKTDIRAQSGGSAWTDSLPNLGNLGNMQEAAQNYMSNMTPEQIAEIQKTVGNMSDEEKKNILKMFSQQFDSGKR